MGFMMELSSLPSLFFPFSSQVRFLSELDFCLGNSQSWILSGSSHFHQYVPVSWPRGQPDLLLNCPSSCWFPAFLHLCLHPSLIQLLVFSPDPPLHGPWCSLPAHLCHPGWSSKSRYILWQSRFRRYLQLLCFSRQATIPPTSPKKGGTKRKKGFLGEAFELERTFQNLLQGHRRILRYHNTINQL